MRPPRLASLRADLCHPQLVPADAGGSRELIRLENITKTYYLGEVDVPVLRGISLTIARGEMVALMGASGSGKTTLMNILGCLDRPTSGEFWFDGQEMSRLSPNERALVRTAKLGFVFQSFNLLPRTSALRNVLMPLDYALRRPGRNEAIVLGESLLEQVSLGSRMDHDPSQMSGGQQQRVAIARALINRPALLLADEPTGNLDSRTGDEILRMFQRLHAEGITVILVTHDAKVAAYADRTIHIADGLVANDSHGPIKDDCRANGSPAGKRLEPDSVLVGLSGNGSLHHHFGNGIALARMIAAQNGNGNGKPADDTAGSIHLAHGPITEGSPWRLEVDARDDDCSAGKRLEPESLFVGLPANGSSHHHCGNGAAPAPHDVGRSSTLFASVLTTEPSGAGEAAEIFGCAARSEPMPSHRRSLASILFPPTLRTALGNLRRNKMRSALTALGVIIGVGAVIAMTEIGEGSKAAIEKTIASMGANKLVIFPSAANTGGVKQGVGTVQTLKPSDVDEIARQCSAVQVVVPMIWAQGQVIYGNKNWAPQQLTGTAPSYLATRDWEDLEEGTCFSDDDVRSSNGVCLIGATVKRELFEDESPIGKTVRIRNVPFRVIGVLSPKGANMQGQDQDDCVIAPWTTIKFRVNGGGAGSTRAMPGTTVSTINTLGNPYPAPTPLYYQGVPTELADTPQAVRQASVDYVQVKASSADEVQPAIEQITALLRERHHLRDDADNDFKVLDLTEIAHASARTAEMMGILLLVVAAISLVVGGVGIMNIMLVSVTERTREIGLRMAVGARRYHILQQFLVEAVLLCLVGGVLGILAGRGTSIVVREIEHWTTKVSVTAIVVSVVVAAGVGIVFGFYPAWKASRLDPIEALRHD